MTAVAQQLVEMSGRSALISASGILDLVPSEPISLRLFRRGNHRTAFAPYANLLTGITARHSQSLSDGRTWSHSDALNLNLWWDD